MRVLLFCLALLTIGLVAGCGDDRGAVFETESDEKRDLKLKEIRKEIDTLGDGRDPNDVEKDVRADRAKNLLIARGTRIEPQLIEALGGHEDWAVRVGVIEVLEALGTRNSIEALIHATGDDHPLVALKADKLLEVMCQHREIPTAAEGLGANDLPPFLGPAADDLALDARERVGDLARRQPRVPAQGVERMVGDEPDDGAAELNEPIGDARGADEFDLAAVAPGARGRFAVALAKVTSSAGCYLFKDPTGRVIYVGKAKNLKKRIGSYFSKGRGHTVFMHRLLEESADIETLETDSEVEALLLENTLIKELQPRMNVRLKDDKDFPMLAVTREEFPRVFVTRDRTLEATDYFGPFISARELYRAYHFLMRVFRFRCCDLDLHEEDPKRRSFRPCLNYHIKRCSAPCTTRIGAAEYGNDIRALKAFVTGRGKKPVVDELTARMRANARELRFEDAARCRDQLHALDRLKERGRLRDYDDAAAPVVDIMAGMESLTRALGLAGLPRVIEGFDIAHLSGTHVVAALVQFTSGVPNKDAYRRFKVRGEDGAGDPGNDDFAAMREVVGRRYRRLRDEGQALPDLCMIDGGHGQLAKAREALREAGVELPCVVGLAKREETIVRLDGSELKLSKRDPGLRLLMYVRDEAHRFCRRYFHLLQRKALEE